MGKSLAMVSKKDLVFEKKGEVFTDTLTVARRIEYDHWKVTRLIESHRSDFEDFGLINFESCLVNQRSSKVYHLNRGQFMLLVTYLRATKKASAVNELKKDMARAFDKLVELVKEKQTAEYKQARLESAETHKTQMAVLGRGLLTQCYIKPTSIANKAVAMMFGIDGRLKKSEMTTEQLHYHAVFLQKAVALIAAQKMGVEIPSVSDVVYAQIPEIRRLMLNE